jgi:hypothetical protein
MSLNSAQTTESSPSGERLSLAAINNTYYWYDRMNPGRQMMALIDPGTTCVSEQSPPPKFLFRKSLRSQVYLLELTCGRIAPRYGYTTGASTLLGPHLRPMTVIPATTPLKPRPPFLMLASVSISPPHKPLELRVYQTELFSLNEKGWTVCIQQKLSDKGNGD